jgi:hypothetical protein
MLAFIFGDASGHKKLVSYDTPINNARLGGFSLWLLQQEWLKHEEKVQVLE